MPKVVVNIAFALLTLSAGCQPGVSTMDFQTEDIGGDESFNPDTVDGGDSTSKTVQDNATDKTVLPTDADQTSAGDTSSTDDRYKSGTRIRAKYIMGEDGSKQWVGWHDIELGSDCIYTQIGDALRCIPPWTSANSSSYYSDDACTSPLGIIGPISLCQGAPAYAIVYTTTESGCGTIKSLNKLGLKVQEDFKLYIKIPGADTCQLTTLGTSLNSSYYFVGEEVPMATFVAASEVIE